LTYGEKAKGKGKEEERVFEMGPYAGKGSSLEIHDREEVDDGT
jgi:hypothetical protein